VQVGELSDAGPDMWLDERNAHEAVRIECPERDCTALDVLTHGRHLSRDGVVTGAVETPRRCAEVA
jgi:hypothetical protein